MYVKKVRYSDGREETIRVPVDYDLGTILAITHKRDGSIVVNLVT